MGSIDGERVREFYNKVGQDHPGLIKRAIAGFRGKEQETIEALLDIEVNDKVLDAGCGSGTYVKMVLQHSTDVYACDFAEDRLPFVKELIEPDRVFQHDLHQPLPVTGFDKILAMGVLEFCAEPVKVAKNLADALVPGGVMYALIPNRSLMGHLYKSYHLLHGFSIHLFGDEQIKELCGTNMQLISTKRTSPHITAIVFQKNG